MTQDQKNLIIGNIIFFVIAVIPLSFFTGIFAIIGFSIGLLFFFPKQFKEKGAPKIKLNDHQDNKSPIAQPTVDPKN